MALAEGVTIFKDLVVATATAGAAIVAVKGITTWRRQLKGTTEYQIALKVLKAVAVLVESIRRARDPFVFGEEAASRQRSPNETAGQSAVLNQSYAFFKRLERVQSARLEVQVGEHEAWALWGASARDALTPLYGLTNNLFSAYRVYFDQRLADADASPRGRDESLRDLYQVLYYHGSKDAFSLELDEAVRIAESWYRVHLKEESIVSWSTHVGRLWTRLVPILRGQWEEKSEGELGDGENL